MKPGQKIWKISPGSRGAGWDDCKKNGTIGIGKIYERDVHGYTEDEVKKYVEEERGTKSYRSLLRFIFEIKKDDVVVAYSSPKTIYGIGIIAENDWVHNKNISREKHWLKNTRKVMWDKTFPSSPATDNIKDEIGVQEPVKEISSNFFVDQILPLLSEESDVRGLFTDSKKSWNLTILNLLDQKSQIILYGPPGTGKTYKAREYAVNFIQKSILEE
jgi:5-methylcytosine-specific restriction protein B